MRPSAPAMVMSLLLAGVLLADEEPARSTKEYGLPVDVEKIQHPAPAANFLPVFEWLWKKARERKGEPSAP